MDEILAKIDGFNQEQQRQLGYFKALELSNASFKMGFLPAPDGLGHSVTELVRVLVSKRAVCIGDERFSIEDPEVGAVVDYGMRLFAEWTRRREHDAPAMALSRHICTALSPWIHDGLVALHLNLPGYSDEYVIKISEQFL